ncbi:amidase [Paenibacillus wynnii]|uniref:amidase n=1 Tax=Paenibacillus wynnii TaxID=268407 RepID=UPI00278EE193|nr:amidase [Paenibacillus wynnii]MDQ0192793.1 Asp-tRNA(Asn)/Glu-tRNA(Gln) amidotransferase A subunit family amidase [Paenibacillus wynnii]
MYLQHASLVDINKGSLTENLTHLYKRYSKVEPYINAFIPEENLEARFFNDANCLLEKFPHQDNRPAFFGIPFAIKDLMHVNGFLTRAGSKLPSDVLTMSEGSFISNLRSMGAVFVGKTVTEEFAYHSVIPTRNPHNIDHTSGGSSAGSAASVAAGICPIAVGTQTLRSVIAPASFCGVVGFKPSYARVALDGVILLSPSFDTIGFFTQDIESMQYASSHLIPNWRSFHSDKKPILGVPSGMYMNFMCDEVRGAFENQLKLLEQAGYTIRNVDMPWDDSFIAGDAMIKMVQAEMAQVHEIWFRKYEHLYGSSVREAIKNGQSVPSEELEQYRAGQLNLRIDLENTKIKNGIDLWVSPAQGGVAPKGFEKTGWAGMTAVWSYAGLPTISIPVAKIDGMPLGFQCIDSHGNDEALLYWTKEIERSLLSK